MLFLFNSMIQYQLWALKIVLEGVIIKTEYFYVKSKEWHSGDINNVSMC